MAVDIAAVSLNIFRYAGNHAAKKWRKSACRFGPKALRDESVEVCSAGLLVVIVADSRARQAHRLMMRARAGGYP